MTTALWAGLLIFILCIALLAFAIWQEQRGDRDDLE
jgi:predicted lipid-binding transport protein (Tim44 family)